MEITVLVPSPQTTILRLTSFQMDYTSRGAVNAAIKHKRCQTSMAPLGHWKLGPYAITEVKHHELNQSSEG